MLGVVRTQAVRAIAPIARRQTTVRQQKRGIVDWMVNYPDKVMETKKLQMKGGTCQGEYDPTWLKQPGDAAVAWFGAALIGYGTFLTTVGFYRLATGKGKKD